MADQVTKETDQRLEEAAARVDKVLRDMEDLTPVGDALLSTRRGLGDASRSIAGLADQAGAAMEQLSVAASERWWPCSWWFRFWAPDEPCGARTAGGA